MDQCNPKENRLKQTILVCFQAFGRPLSKEAFTYKEFAYISYIDILSRKYKDIFKKYMHLLFAL